MKRCILLSTRTNEDKDTGDQLLFLTLSNLPKRMKNGGLWHPKSSEMLTTACINKTRKPDDYEKFVKLLPGTLLDVTEGINDFTNKRFVASLDIVPGTENIYDEQLLYQRGSQYVPRGNH